MKKMIIFLFTFLVSGCASNPPIQPVATPAQSQASAIEDHKAICSNYGFTYGTPEFGNCMMTLGQQLIDRQNQIRQETIDRQNNDRAARGQALRDWSNSLKSPNANTKDTFNRGLSGYGNSNSTHCTSKPGLGTGSMATVETHCY